MFWCIFAGLVCDGVIHTQFSPLLCPLLSHILCFDTAEFTVFLFSFPYFSLHFKTSKVKCKVSFLLLNATLTSSHRQAVSSRYSHYFTVTTPSDKMNQNTGPWLQLCCKFGLTVLKSVALTPTASARWSSDHLTAKRYENTGDCPTLVLSVYLQVNCQNDGGCFVLCSLRWSNLLSDILLQMRAFYLHRQPTAIVQLHVQLLFGCTV